MYLNAKGRFVIVITLIFAVLNICLGFALATYLRGEPYEAGGAAEDAIAGSADAAAAPAGELQETAST